MAAICDWIRGDGVIVCVVGTTVLSVIHYERGRTSHSAFGIPVQRSDEGLESRIRAMTKKVVWECVDQLLRNIMSNDLPFGAKAFGTGRFPSSGTRHSS
jgi:hypothetical protein